MERNERPAVVLAICVLALTLPTQAKVIYVGRDAAGVNDGSSWVNAYNRLQDGLADANAADKPVEIRVAQGTYTPDRGRGVRAQDREATFRLVNGVTLQGGYAGIGSADPNECDPAKYVCILSGDLAGNDAPVQSADQLLGEPTRSDNSRRVVTASIDDSIETGAVIDGFTITAGQDDVEADDLASEGGAGILVLSGVLAITDCTIRNNATYNVGGAMCATASCRLSLRHCTVMGNYAQYGGGIASGRLYAVSEGCRLAMTDCTFSNNLAFQGAGLFAYGGYTEATNCTFGANVAAGDDDAAFGGAMYLLGGDVVLTGCSFNGNAAYRAGGAISQAAGNAQMSSCTFNRNTADIGGAIDMSACDSLLDGCSFTGNVAPSGGGLHSVVCSTTLKHCLFAGNGSNLTSRRPFGSHQEGGAIYLLGNATLANCTFHGNLAQKGRSLWMSQSDVAATNCILWDGDGQIFSDEDSLLTITYSDVLGARRGEGNIDADPCFAQLGYWDPNGTPRDTRDDFWVDGDYHLKSQAGRWNPNSQSWVLDASSSPCIDAGDPDTPVGDEPQPNGRRINMGAYGGTAEASKSFADPQACKTSDGLGIVAEGTTERNRVTAVKGRAF